MPKSWEELLIPGASRADLLRELASISRSGPGGRSGSSASITASDVLGSAVQGPGPDVGEQLSSLSAHISTLSSAQQALTAATQDNTQAVTQNTAGKSSAGSSAGATVGGMASSLLGGGLTLSPIISGLLSLFGAGSGSPTTATVPFQLPAPVQYEGGLTGGPSSGVVPVSYGDMAQPRSQNAKVAPQVNIQVNAMDSQSFLDHSGEIADAVKQAILSSHSLNDVIAEL